MPRPLRLVLIGMLCAAAGFFVGRALWTPPPGAPAAPAGASAPTRVPEFELRDLDGNLRSSPEWTSQPLIINFWATWCAPCRREMPLLEQLHTERAAGGLAVIGIAIDREEPVRTFVAETGVTYPILLGELDAMRVAESFGSDFVGLPYTVIAAPGGDILKLHVGELHPPELAEIVEVLDRLAAGALTIAGAREALAES